MIQHDMMMFDHGMPGPDGKVSPEQRREADVNIELAIDQEQLKKYIAKLEASQSSDPEARAKAIVKATTYYKDPAKVLEASEDLDQVHEI